MLNRKKEPSVVGLKNIQNEFDVYQKNAFESRSPSFFSLELCGECGELANLEKKIWRDPSKEIEMEKLSDEAADVFIALMNYCNTRNIDLENSVMIKLVKIEEKRLLGQMGKIK